MESRASHLRGPEWVAVTFRNVDAQWSDPVSTWPYEALVTTLERGIVWDWQPVFREVEARPWGKVARWVLNYLETQEPRGLNILFAEVVRLARHEAELRERDAVAARVRAAIERSGLSAKDFAAEIGTSASRLSTYATGHVVPSATMLVRIEGHLAPA
jgi:DNA-binding transcriptional regulator YiaG